MFSVDDRLLVRILDSLEFIVRRSFSDISIGSGASDCRICQFGNDLNKKNNNNQGWHSTLLVMDMRKA